MTPLPASSRWCRPLLVVALSLVSVPFAAPANAAAPQPEGEPQPPSSTAAPQGSEQPPTPEAAPAVAKAPEPEVKRVLFLPETLKVQLREELKKEVLEQAAREGWAAPNQVAAWLKRFKFSGDVRGRFERDIFSPGNADNGEFPDFNAINTNKPYDVNGVDLTNDRYLNVDQSRNRPRLRARLGVQVELTQWLTGGLRLGSGDSNSPLSSNQTLGASGGLFSKYQLWLDVGYLRLEPIKELVVLQLGRFANPFFGTALLWWDDLNLDGIAYQGALPVGGGFRPFLTAGAFPLYTSAFSFPAEQSTKVPSRNKWLYAVQLGSEWTPRPGFTVKLAGAFYDFDKLEGATSHACDTNLKDISCDSDESRPSFAQKGNTYIALRTPSDAALAAQQSFLVPQYQYFGLASRFRELVATAAVDYLLASSLLVGLDGEYVHNAGFKKDEVIQKVPINNRGALDGTDPLGPYVGGNDGLLVRLRIGSPHLEQLGDWRARLAYRYLESDAAVDALNDPDFGLGGTNLKGYTVDLSLALGGGLVATARWNSADQIVGPKYAVDVLQLDLAARF